MAKTGLNRDTPSRKGAGRILGKVHDKLGGKIVDRMGDREGMFAWITKDAVVVGRQYVWTERGDIVSCHEDAVLEAEHEGLGLVMYIEDHDGFYAFNPSNIKRNKTENRKGDAVMYNFDFGLGEKIPLHDV